MCNQVPCRCSCDTKVVTTDEALWEDHPQLNCHPGRFLFGSVVLHGKQYQELALVIPDGVLIAIPVYRDGTPPPAIQSPCWQWDGNLIRPTLTPSILCYTSREGKRIEAWHGYLTAGRLVSC